MHFSRTFILTLILWRFRDVIDDFSDAEPDIFEPDDVEDGQQEQGGAEDPDALEPENRNNNIVVSGDAEAAKKAEERNTVKSMRDKKVPNEKRTTTPYMTKYERARVLGTRALQIR